MREDWGLGEGAGEQEGKDMDSNTTATVTKTRYPPHTASKSSTITDFFPRMRIQYKYKKMDESWLGNKEEQEDFLDMMTAYLDQTSQAVHDPDEDVSPMLPPYKKDIINVRDDGDDMNLGGRVAKTIQPPPCKDDHVTLEDDDCSIMCPSRQGDIVSNREGFEDEDLWVSQHDSFEDMLSKEECLSSQEYYPGERQQPISPLLGCLTRRIIG